VPLRSTGRSTDSSASFANGNAVSSPTSVTEGLNRGRASKRVQAAALYSLYVPEIDALAIGRGLLGVPDLRKDYENGYNNAK
jgi:hypothetical protein